MKSTESIINGKMFAISNVLFKAYTEQLHDQFISNETLTKIINTLNFQIYTRIISNIIEK